MTVTVHPTLQTMATIYSLPTSGGADSVRFRSYVELASSGHRIHEYNPMTGNPATPETVDALISIGAEQLVEETLAEIPDIGDVDTAVVVLTQGFWTDRLFNEVRNRRDGKGMIWFWSGEPVDSDTVVAATRAEAARISWRSEQGSPRNLLEFAAQEATAAVAAGFEPAHSDQKVAEILEVAGEDGDDHTLIGYLFGDEIAEAADWRGIGLEGDEGPRTVARWLADSMTWQQAASGGWTPTPPQG